MKSRTSFFNLTVLKRNITRFAPAWALYSIFLLMALVILATDTDTYSFTCSIAEFITPFALFNFFYALLCAQLLFGDLYNSRMCNALHAMPLRREGWFLTNAVSGLFFSLVPNTLFALLCLPFVERFIPIPFLWLGGVTLQYLFFFGTAVLSAYCVGNRFAMALVYIIINGFSVIVYWLVETLYAPLMYGVVINEELFFDFAPVIRMVAERTYVEMVNPGDVSAARWYLGEGWGYLGICAALGLGCLGLALAAYRKRNLECAGDFVAIKWLSPIFLVLYTLCGGACCHGFFSLFIGEESYLFLLLGFVIGFFTGRMLLERTVKVFRKKSFLAFGAFLIAFMLSFVVVRVDVLGITRWVPKVNQVKGVAITTGSSYYYSDRQTPLTDPRQIEDVIAIHKHGLDNPYEVGDGEPDVRFFVTYYMNDGSQRTREYYINHDSDAGRSLKSYMSSPEVVLGEIYTGQWKPVEVDLPGADIRITDAAEIQSLMDAVLADCRAGNLAQDWNYIDNAPYQFWIEILCKGPNDYNYYCSIRASSYAENVVAWLESHPTYKELWNLYKDNETFAK